MTSGSVDPFHTGVCVRLGATCKLHTAVIGFKMQGVTACLHVLGKACGAHACRTHTELGAHEQSASCRLCDGAQYSHGLEILKPWNLLQHTVELGTWPLPSAPAGIRHLPIQQRQLCRAAVQRSALFQACCTLLPPLFLRKCCAVLPWSCPLLHPKQNVLWSVTSTSVSSYPT